MRILNLLGSPLKPLSASESLALGPSLLHAKVKGLVLLLLVLLAGVLLALLVVNRQAPGDTLANELHTNRLASVSQSMKDMETCKCV